MDEYKFTDKKEMLQFVRDMVSVSEDMGTPISNIDVTEYHSASCDIDNCKCVVTYGVDLAQMFEYGRPESRHNGRTECKPCHG